LIVPRDAGAHLRRLIHVLDETLSLFGDKRCDQRCDTSALRARTMPPGLLVSKSS
jgi:hypothetical protein